MGSLLVLLLLGNSGGMRVSASSKAGLPGPVSFNHQIRPILSDNCFACHGADAHQLKADLSLVSFQHAVTELRSGRQAVYPGDRQRSVLWERINDAGDPMPPVDSHKTLTKEQIAMLGRWIDEGATYDLHWSYAPPVSPGIPTVRDPDWPRSPMDRFVLARLEAQGLAPGREADRETLLRRISLDLTGLPPTPELRAQFLPSEEPDAYESVVDALLGESSFGEHFAAGWLDLVRYADTVGFHGDQSRNMWPYRSWVIDALNDNMPFDRFTRWQLAGDILARREEEPALRQDMLIASAYNRLNLVTAEGGAQVAEYETIYDADRVQNFSEVWLASSLACARCHDHKYDPFTMRDFYGMAAYFADIDEVIVSNQNTNPYWLPYVFVPQSEEQRTDIAGVESAYAGVLAAHPARAAELEKRSADRYLKPNPAEPWETEFLELVKKRRELGSRVPTVSIARARPHPRAVHLLPRGNWMDRSGPIVPPAFPAFLAESSPAAASGRNRLDLAEWLFGPGHPLTARVVVNRLWARFFGRGLSDNVMDLGSQGAAPSHPELLDFLALSFQESGWDLKQAIRTMVTSSTYRQDSNAPTELTRLDPGNRLLARQGALRLPIEVIRDQALWVSGLLHHETGGASAFPYQPQGHWEPLNFPRRPYPVSRGLDLYRRSLYTWIQRTFPHPVMTTFDAPNRETCVAQRLSSNTPVQALTLLNETAFVEAARVFAARILEEGLQGDSARMDYAFRRLLTRRPRAEEVQTMLGLLTRHRRWFEAHPEEALNLIRIGEHPVFEAKPAAETAAWTSVTRTLLNLHETVTRN